MAMRMVMHVQSLLGILSEPGWIIENDGKGEFDDDIL
jgi:hypothetical protein